ncbi:hypothetical protein J7337_002048 [Fusarium musae]|uniref:Uncharacterized protein n=1 Tax=Fusarium musae TaxID=1042133 RepID=A0A9P8DN61_9HYPO|nr:hypothetical protein J7337_002048 [Fusarium musae]KAG9505082.1 hypothetical protein J7337_002048 [Fusarium musae]
MYLLVRSHKALHVVSWVIFHRTPKRSWKSSAWRYFSGDHSSQRITKLHTRKPRIDDCINNRSLEEISEVFGKYSEDAPEKKFEATDIECIEHQRKEKE